MHDGRFARDGLLRDTERMKIFQAVVQAQDEGVGLMDSRDLVAKKFGVSVDRVKSIEKEGLIHEWLDLCP
jgi:hypothetical protein